VAALVLALVCAAGCSADDGDFEGLLATPHDDTVTGEEAFAAASAAVGDAYHRIEGAPEVSPDIVSVGRVGPQPYGQVYIRVVLRSPVENPPGDECAINHSDNVTGLVYLVSDPPATVEAVSLEWDASVSCLGDTGPTPAR
jgi:hypothetical protein